MEIQGAGLYAPAMAPSGLLGRRRGGPTADGGRYGPWAVDLRICYRD